jgi:TonB family protein
MKAFALFAAGLAAVLSSYADLTPQPSSPPSLETGIPVLDLSQVDQAPKIKSQPRPGYPFTERQAAISGDAFIDFVVDPSGCVRNATVRAASLPDFGDAALQAVSQWTFTAGRKDGHAVYVHMQVPIVFKLDSIPPAGNR